MTNKIGVASFDTIQLTIVIVMPDQTSFPDHQFDVGYQQPSSGTDNKRNLLVGSNKGSKILSLPAHLTFYPKVR